MAKMPTMDEWVEKISNKVLNEYVYKGRTLKEWIDLMAAEETKKKTREKSATDIIHEVAEEMCMHYCKYPEQWDEETQGDLFDSEYCQNCPLERLC